MKKVNLFVGALLFFVVLGVSTVSADALSPDEALSNAYDASLEGDSKKYYDSVIDERFDSPEEARFFYDGAFLEDPLVDYKIVDSKKINKNNYEFTVMAEYKSGLSLKLPAKVTDINGAWKVLITDEILEEDEFEVLNTGSVLNKNANMILPGLELTELEGTYQPQSGRLYRSFNVSMRSHIDIGIVNIPTTALVLSISNQSTSGNLNYSVWKKLSHGNTTLASRTVSGNKKNYTTSLTLSYNPGTANFRIAGSGSSNGGLYY
ncbi:hypothetical protein [Oceanobacillus luteolus]|uniref:Uncharacterized protein n=1 Tax=Oceanobacillus luteolus TaxID=1274358 RepID=A0ABW4HUK5_9BACI